MPPVMLHVIPVKRLMLRLGACEQRTGQCKAFAEAPFILPDQDDSNWVSGSRVPDVMVVTAERLKNYRASQPDWAHKPLLLIPDLVIEVVFPGDRYSVVNAKADRYLQDGVQIVWVVDPQRQAITEHRRDSDQQMQFSGADMLSGDPLLPGFSLALAALFVELG